MDFKSKIIIGLKFNSSWFYNYIIYFKLGSILWCKSSQLNDKPGEKAWEKQEKNMGNIQNNKRDYIIFIQKHEESNISHQFY